ncbi:uncharacterized protein LOC143179785 [Calliopsis andreniformis]|uniref:uncharacterized protein LOC143179785 n=1 Tax=Calliopsis andreniformis TaxID=337506 RepID=UPI003FCED8E6
MKNSAMEVATFLLFFVLYLSEATDPNFNAKSKNLKAQNKVFGHRPSNGLVTFNSEDDKLRIDWAVTIPFISIPIHHKIGENGEPEPLLNVNTKALGIVGILTTLFSVIKPLFSKPHHPHLNYRSEDNTEWLQMGNNINEMFFNNNYVTPCMQHMVCSIVSVAAHSENPTSMDKIIDGLSSHKWFKDVVNGTIIQDAIAVGRNRDQNCVHVYKGCLITPKLLKTVMNEFGIM